MFYIKKYSNILYLECQIPLSVSVSLPPSCGRLLLGFMMTTAFLSMWISNTATAAMMLAIAHAVLRELEEETSITHGDGDTGRGEPPQSPVQIIYAKRYNSASGELSEEVTVQLERGSEKEREEGEGGVVDGGRDSLLETGPTEERNEVSGTDDEEIDSSERRDIGGCVEGPSPRPPSRTLQKMSKVLMLGVAYSANIGGTATLTGTGPNIILSGLSVR